jgi:hypothetical protein
MSSPLLPTLRRQTGSARRKIVGGALAAALALAVPGVAGAAVPNIRTTVSSLAAANVSTVAQRCEAAITDRQGQIQTLGAQISGAQNLSSAHASTLQGALASDHSGLASLYGQIQSATTIKQLLPLCAQIVGGFRVYLLETPKVHLTIGSDAEQAVVAKLQGVGSKLEAAITSAQGKGQDVGNAPALYADFTSKVADASAKSVDVAGQVLPLTASQYDAGTAKPILLDSYSSLLQGRSDLVAARSDAVQIVQILQALLPAATTTTT